MENKIYKMKEKLLDKIEQEMQDPDRMNINQVSTLIDAVHHLAETEYYCSVADAMWAEKHGYGSGSQQAPVTQARSGYSEMPMRSGYGMPNNSMGYGSMGYDGVIEKLGEEFRNAKPEERMMMKSKVMSAIGGM